MRGIKTTRGFNVPDIVAGGGIECTHDLLGQFIGWEERSPRIGKRKERAKKAVRPAGKTKKERKRDYRKNEGRRSDAEKCYTSTGQGE